MKLLDRNYTITDVKWDQELFAPAGGQRFVEAIVTFKERLGDEEVVEKYRDEDEFYMIWTQLQDQQEGNW